MVEIHIIQSDRSGRWFEAVREFYGVVGYQQELGNNETFIIATIDDCIVGCCRLCDENGLKVLRGMQVHPHFRRQGIGSQLLERVREIIGDHECYCLPFTYLEQFYNKIGFIRVDEKKAPTLFYKRYCDYKDKSLDVIIMKKEGRQLDQA